MKMPKLNNSLFRFLLLALGIYLGSLSLFNIGFLLCLFLVLVMLWLCLAYRGKGLRGWWYGLILALGTVLVGHISVTPERAWVTPAEGEFTGIVYSVQPLTYDTRLLVRLEPTRLKVAVHVTKDVAIAPGDELVFVGTIAQPDQAPNPGVFCYRDYLRRLGVFGVSYPQGVEVRPRNGGLLQSFRTWMRNNLGQHVQEPGLVLALVLGERDQLGTRRESWRLLGVSHLLAISGMHVGIVALGLGLVVQRLPWGSLAKVLLIQGTLLAYIVVAGSSASAWRAVLVSILGGYASLMNLRQDPLQLWATVGSILLLAQPSLLFDAGFALSFAASGGILLWSASIKVRCKNIVLRYLLSSLLISGIAQISLAPFLFHYFREIAIMAPLATLIFLPLVVLMMVSGLLVALGLGPLGVGQLVNAVMSMVNALEHMLLPFARQWPLGSLALSEVMLWWFVFVYAGWRLRQPRLTKPKRTLAQLATISVAALLITCLPSVVRRPLEITAVNVGQGDCYYIRTPSGLHLLMDGGGDSLYWQERGRNVGEQRLVPYLRYRQVPRLDYVIVSHPHEDHLFGLLAVLQHFEVGMVIDNGHAHASPTYERYVDLLTEKGIPYHMTRAGDQLTLGDGISLSVLYPDYLRPSLPSAHNNNSLLVRLEYGGFRLLFTGDLEAAVLYDLVHDAKIDLSAQWVKVPHHGSRGSLLEEFYQAVNPKWAMISQGSLGSAWRKEDCLAHHGEGTANFPNLVGAVGEVYFWSIVN